jgi:hypothetical protein
MSLKAKLDALPPWADEISLAGLGEDPRAVALYAALARLALAREWIEDAHGRHCSYDGSYEGGECSCERSELLKALEVPNE